MVPENDAAAPKPIPNEMKALADIVRAGRLKPRKAAGILTMHQLTKQYSLVGFSRAQITELFGEPTREREDELEYKFDNGNGGWIWTLTMQKGIISVVDKTSLE